MIKNLHNIISLTYNSLNIYVFERFSCFIESHNLRAPAGRIFQDTKLKLSYKNCQGTFLKLYKLKFVLSILKTKTFTY